MYRFYYLKEFNSYIMLLLKLDHVANINIKIFIIPEMSATEPETSDPFRTYLKVAVSGLLTELGFSTAETTAMETLTELTQSFIVELGRSARSFCELACRVEPVSADILLALVEMGVPVSGIQTYAHRSQRVTIPAPSLLTTPKQTSILHTGK